LLGVAARLLLSIALVVSLWSGVMAAPLSGAIANKPVCCHAVKMAGHDEAQGACGCAQNSPCRMKANPFAPVLPALLQGNVLQTSLAQSPIWASAGDITTPAAEIVTGSRMLLKPPVRLYILHANLLI
jgi:hypothetical protein